MNAPTPRTPADPTDRPEPDGGWPAAVVDQLLEWPVAPSFTRVGYDVRSRLAQWRPLTGYDLSGRVVAVTGPTSGLGRAAARQLAGCGASVVLLARDRGRAEVVRAELAELAGEDRASVVAVDMADPAAVREAARAVLDLGVRLDALVHNAGALYAERRVTSTGTEVTVASQVVGPFLLTGLLLDRLRAASPGRVVTVSSGGMYAAALDVEHLEMGDDYRGTEQYARAKRAQVTLNELWAEHTRGTDVVFHAMHPGWADTPGVAASLPRFRRLVGPLLRSPDQGADTITWLVADDGAPARTTGRFWMDRRPRPTHRLPTTRHHDTPEERDRLWDWCVEQSGLDPSA